MKPNWEAVGALGEWVGAIATFWAVRVAIAGIRATLRVTTWVGISDGELTLTVRATNAGPVDIRPIEMGVVAPSGLFISIVPRPGEVDRPLRPGEETYVTTRLDGLARHGISPSQRLHVFGFAQDGLGRIHLESSGTLKGLWRHFSVWRNRDLRKVSARK